ncbi:unnamed protein product [Cylicocyclus nassatus]|uniref:Uncharacterized protein n=1 Tax=Cylicocyclus nassatus TaxID=53992 RepID=A0AA36M557_CYLNA|nr:unnamed protein product [Cylicocyclus nassatus]
MKPIYEKVASLRSDAKQKKDRNLEVQNLESVLEKRRLEFLLSRTQLRNLYNSANFLIAMGTFSKSEWNAMNQNEVENTENDLFTDEQSIEIMIEGQLQLIQQNEKVLKHLHSELRPAEKTESSIDDDMRQALIALKSACEKVLYTHPMKECTDASEQHDVSKYHERPTTTEANTQTTDLLREISAEAADSDNNSWDTEEPNMDERSKDTDQYSSTDERQQTPDETEAKHSREIVADEEETTSSRETKEKSNASDWRERSPPDELVIDDDIMIVDELEEEQTLTDDAERRENTSAILSITMHCRTLLALLLVKIAATTDIEESPLPSRDESNRYYVHKITLPYNPPRTESQKLADCQKLEFVHVFPPELTARKTHVEVRGFYEKAYDWFELPAIEQQRQRDNVMNTLNDVEKEEVAQLVERTSKKVDEDPVLSAHRYFHSPQRVIEEMERSHASP